MSVATIIMETTRYKHIEVIKMIKQQETEIKKQKQTKNKEKEIKMKYAIFLGEFTLEEYLEKEANLIIARIKQEGNK